MARGFETGSDNEKIDELQRQLDNINDSQISSVGGNENISIDSTRGSRNAAGGDSGGVRSNEPITHNITDVDEGGTSTGVFDKINIISSMAIIDHTSTPFTLRFIQGPAKDGARIKITPKIGKTFNVESGGNILTSSTITISDTEYYELVKYSEAETGVTGGAWKIFKTGAGGGGITFPIDFPEDDRGTVGASTQEILFTDADRHSVKMIVSGDVELAFSSPPTNETAYTNIIIVQDGTGGHTVTVPPGTVNKDIVDAGILTGPNEETGIVIKFAFGIFYAFLETGNIVTGGSSFSGDLSDLVIDVNKNWAAQGISNFGNLTGVTGIDMDGATATIQGVVNLNFFQANHSINSLSGAMFFQVDSTDFFGFLAGCIQIARFEEAAAGVFRLNMLEHSIRDAKDITFDVGATNSVPGSSPGIGYDTSPSRLVINVPAGSHLAISENTVVGSTQIFDDGVLSNDLTATTNLFIGILGAAPSVAGQFTNDATDVFVFSGGSVRNLSNISTFIGATRELDNLTTTDINVPLLPEASATLDLGSELFPWRIGHFREIEFPVTTSAPTGITDTQISVNTSNNMAFNNSVNGGGYLWYFEGVEKWAMTATQFSGDFILLQNSLTFNDSTTNPVGDGELTRNGDSMILQSPIFQIQRATTGTFSGDFNLTKVDAAPSGGEPIYKINFNLFDSPTSITYAQIVGRIEDVTDAGILEFGVRSDGVSNVNALTIEGSTSTSNRTFVSLNVESRIGSDLKFQAPTGSTDLKIFPALNQLGIVVQDNVSFTVGSAGMLAAPITNTLPGSAAGADAVFGDHDGAIGFFDSGGANLTLLVRQLNGDWASVNLVRGTLT